MTPTPTLLSQEDIIYLLETARLAGAEILAVYHNASLFNAVDYKADDSPLTIADQRAHLLIEKRLQQRFPHIPILSEEGSHIPYAERQHWSRCWLVDPLDGTKEFIKRNGEFTVNIALIEQGKTQWGVIYVPDGEVLYWGGAAYGAFKQAGGVEVQKLQVSNKEQDLIAVGSRSHSGEEDEAILKQYPIKDFVSSGSSIKFCLVAEGAADLYYRGKPTMEWDTAAGQAIVEGAGGQVLMGDKPMRYNRENLRNGSFMCKGF
ncbi:3'(2'),5'-bisphosphate nucleotidase CysQ [Cesiribacter andamanensis]|uniref:3'(2'),5'-bisphosphate nucleotidase CysQ n=1 Tax=Cesiribacter andamanensis AMV16 TaxID=1279009 RepID=M7NAJ2_9BACT|nr:3'(2'),5'-bisphosphate nucleotidase CysQ [Cesiribacter andamanensis]EMR04257.1 3'(2'),5'-bisphosphate nucleotidase CysQ [Cesiribacter andamanensis AMV16]